MIPPSKDPATGWKAPHQGLIQGVYILPFPYSTASQMGGSSPSTATLYAKQSFRRESAATFPVGVDREGEGTSALTPATNTPCSAAVKAWRA